MDHTEAAEKLSAQLNGQHPSFKSVEIKTKEGEPVGLIVNFQLSEKAQSFADSRPDIIVGPIVETFRQENGMPVEFNLGRQSKGSSR